MPHRPEQTLVPPSAPLDRLSPLLRRFSLRAHLFHAGPLCGVTHFDARPGRGFLHVMRQGEMVVTHRARSGAPRRLAVREPSLLFYARPLAHDFHNAPTDGADFSCATVDFEGGEQHPLVQALPPVVVLPLARVAGLEQTLQLLFAETAQVLCGQRLVADRLFEVLLIQVLRWLLDEGAAGSGDAALAGASTTAKAAATATATALPTGLLAGLADARLARPLTALHEQPAQPWTLAALAARAGMSRSAFAAAFKARVGKAPVEYLAQWRLALVQGPLRQGQPIKQVADAVGYASASALSRAFARHHGVSPRQWLRGVTNEGG